MENIKEIIKKDIFNILDKLAEIRINEIPNFKLYKNMSICFSDSFENYRTMDKQDDDFIKQLTNKLTSEIKSLHEIIETNTDDFELFKLLNDSFIKLTKILYIINKVKQSKNYEDNKEYIFLLRSGDWQKVICKDIDITMNTEKDKLESISFIPCNESCEEDIIPLFLNINEVVGIFPSRKNKKDKNRENIMKKENNLLKENS